MRTRTRLVAGTAATLMALTPVAATPASADTSVGSAAAKVLLPPKNAKYNGVTGQNNGLILNVSRNRKSVKLIGFRVACGDDQGGIGVTGLQNLKLTKTSKGYKFKGTARSAVSFADGTSEIGAVGVSGKFSRNAKTAAGNLAVITERCGSSGAIGWFAAR